MNHRLRIGPGVRLTFQGELLEIIEIRTTSFGNVVAVKPVGTTQIRAIALREILMYHSEHAHDERHEVGTSDGPEDVAATVLAMLNQAERRKLRERADHIREVLTGCPAAAASSDDIGAAKPEYHPSLPLTARYEAKAAELGVDVRTVQRMVAAFREHGEAGLVRGKGVRVKTLPSVDERWREIAIEVMVEHTDQSRPSRTAVIRRTNARVSARFGTDVVPIPSRATAFRVLAELESKHPTFRLSTKRNRDIAERNPGVYGKLRPTQ
ncbi:hypothetical protein [Mycolicibacterium houstonense]|uniref:hypothetical protein n=1 Tax=Mycolicibacterium houstonense TaxID=146021 RepID=UPI003F9DEDDA